MIYVTGWIGRVELWGMPYGPPIERPILDLMREAAERVPCHAGENKL